MLKVIPFNRRPHSQEVVYGLHQATTPVPPSFQSSMRDQGDYWLPGRTEIPLAATNDSKCRGHTAAPEHPCTVGLGLPQSHSLSSTGLRTLISADCPSEPFKMHREDVLSDLLLLPPEMMNVPPLGDYFGASQEVHGTGLSCSCPLSNSSHVGRD